MRHGSFTKACSSSGTAVKRRWQQLKLRVGNPWLSDGDAVEQRLGRKNTYRRPLLEEGSQTLDAFWRCPLISQPPCRVIDEVVGDVLRTNVEEEGIRQDANKHARCARIQHIESAATAGHTWPATPRMRSFDAATADGAASMMHFRSMASACSRSSGVSTTSCNSPISRARGAVKRSAVKKYLPVLDTTRTRGRAKLHPKTVRRATSLPCSPLTDTTGCTQDETRTDERVQGQCAR